VQSPSEDSERISKTTPVKLAGLNKGSEHKLGVWGLDVITSAATVTAQAVPFFFGKRKGRLAPPFRDFFSLYAVFSGSI